MNRQEAVRRATELVEQMSVEELASQLRFDAANTIAITGGDLMAALDGQVVPTYRAVTVQAGQTLRFQAPKTGCRAYIALPEVWTFPRSWAAAPPT